MANVSSTTPSLARSLVTVPLAELLLDTQILAPSKVIQVGHDPAGNVPRFAPSLARSLVTIPSWEFVTQMLAPSKTRPNGPFPTGKLWIWKSPGSSGSALAAKGESTVRPRNNTDISARAGVFGVFMILFSFHSPFHTSVTFWVIPPRASDAKLLPFCRAPHRQV